MLLMSGSQDQQVLIAVIGDSNVGKTSLLLRFTDNSFSQRQEEALILDTKDKVLKIDDEVVKVTVRDTAGQERYRSLTSVMYRGLDGVMLVYDVTKVKTFGNIKYWTEDVNKYTKGNVSLVLVGNKTDLPSEHREIKYEAGEKFAASQENMLFLETSAKTPVNVTEAFVLLTKRIIKRKDRNMYHIDSAINAPSESEDKKTKSGCC